MFIAKVHQLIAQAASTNFPTPDKPMSPNLLPISEDTAKVGYYIGTVDGPRVTIDYYGAAVTPDKGSIHQTPDLSGKWQKLDSIGCSLNGVEFLVPEGESYSIVHDSTDKATARGETGYLGTTAKILAGANASTAKTSAGAPLVKAVNTGWAPGAETRSDVLTLWGMADLGAAHGDTYVLSLTFQPGDLSSEKLESGEVVLATKDAQGRWINAVEANIADAQAEDAPPKKFVLGPCQSDCGLGAYGIDPATHTAWAVVNHAGEFAVTTMAR